MSIAVVGRFRPLAAGLAALALLGARPLRAQDTTRTDTARVRADSAHQAGPVRSDTAPAVLPVPVPADTSRVVTQIRVPPPVPPTWGFGLEIGFTDIGGNTSLQVFNGVFTSEHKRTTDYVFNTRLEARYGRSGATTAAEYSALHTRFDWRPRTQLSPFMEFDVESDMLAKYDARVTTGTGLNINIAPREDRHTTFSVGLAAEIEDRFEHVVPNHVSDVRFTFRFNTLQPVDGTAVFECNATLQPATDDLGDYLWSSMTSLKVTITKKLAFRTRYEWKRDSTPAPGVRSRDDRAFTVALALSW